MTVARSVILLACILLLLSCSEDSYVCKPIHYLTPTEYTVYEYNSVNRVESIVHYIGTEPTQQKIVYDDRNRIEAVLMLGQNGIVNRRVEVMYDETTGLPMALHARKLSSDPPEVTNFYHDDQRQLAKIEIPKGSDKIIYRYEYDDDLNVIRIYYTLPGEPEFLGRENLTFNQESTMHSRVSELAFVDAYIFYRLPLKRNVLTALVYSNGPNYKIDPPASVNYTYDFDGEGRILSGTSDYRGLIGEFNFSEVAYSCK